MGGEKMELDLPILALLRKAGKTAFLQIMQFKMKTLGF